MQGDSEEYTAWIGKSVTTQDPLALPQARAAAAMFDRGAAEMQVGTTLPPLWHWFYFLEPAVQSSLSADGHPARGAFLPPIPYPRRMFAGGRLTFHAPLRIGMPAERTAVIRNVTLKTGRSGSLAFVTVGYRITQAGVLCVDEEQDVVYREPGAAVPPPALLPWPEAAPDVITHVMTPDTRLLFRFSALTFNAHRIHYDRDYAAREEGYPGLVVHGPLIAMQLMALATEVAGARVTEFTFRSERPVFDLAPYRLEAERTGSTLQLTALGPDGAPAQRATAVIAA
jgi:3-methylfumaryl-CoA hydratase